MSSKLSIGFELFLCSEVCICYTLDYIVTTVWPPAGGVVWRFDVVFYFLEFLSSENQYVPDPPSPTPLFFRSYETVFFYCDSMGVVGSHVKKKGPPNYCEFFSTGHWGPLWSKRKMGLLFSGYFSKLKAFQL